MKTLTLHCVCGMTRTFKGRDAKEVIAAIDASGWNDYPDKKKEYGKGHAPGLCPECEALEVGETFAPKGE